VPVFLTSNDPMMPVTEVHLRGTAKLGADGGAVNTDSGCGCRAAGESRSNVPAWAGIGLVAVVLVRRRRR